MRPYQFIVDEKENQTATIIDINDFRQIQKFLKEPQDSDGLIFEARKNEESIPIEKCDEILERIRQIKTTRNYSGR
ncbi:MAG: hypothetical protein AB1797_13955 [bacterium]